MNIIERVLKLSGIHTVVEAVGSKKYENCDKDDLQRVKKELQGIIANTTRSTFKYKNAVEELKVVEDCLKKLEEASESEEVKESQVCVAEAKDDEKCEAESTKKSEDSDKESDESEEDSEKESDGSDDEDEKEEKKDGESDESEEDSDKESDSSDDEDEKEEKKDGDKKEVKESESIEVIVSRILEKEVEVDYQNGPTENSGIKQERAIKVRLPINVKTAVRKRINELQKAIESYDDKGYNDKSIKQQAVECLEQILQDLSTNDVEGVKKAQVYFGTLMSPLTDFFPPQLINWLANAVNPLVNKGE